MPTCMRASLQKADGGNEMDGRDNRRMILHIMAGGYLMYLAYGIGKEVTERRRRTGSF